MKYYAHYGHKDFILCLGYKGDCLRNYFRTYDPNLTRDFCIEPGGGIYPDVSDIADWKITFVDTGLHSNIGQRLLRVKDHLEGEEAFLANYSDQLSDLPLNDYIDSFNSKSVQASFIAVRPSQSFHSVLVAEDGLVEKIEPVQDAEFRINGGYMILRNSIFSEINDGEELVEEPFARLIKKRKLYAHRFDGFWASMDTFKDKIILDRMHGGENRPWQVWDQL